MKRWGWFGILVAVGVGIAVAWWWTAGAPSTAQAANLLANPGFEGAYAVQDGQGTLIVAPNWRAFWQDGGELPKWVYQGGSSSPIRKPEYKAATLGVDAGRVLSGDKAQCLFVFYGVMVAGVQQAVTGISPGSTVQATFHTQTWTSAKDDPTQSTGEMYVAVGIDPYGGSDPWARRVIWSDWQAPSYKYGQFNTNSSPLVQARAVRVTVFLVAHHKWSVKHGDLYVDDASLVAVPGGDCPPCPTPAPTYTPMPCPTCVPGGGCDYDRIKRDLRDVINDTRLSVP